MKHYHIFLLSVLVLLACSKSETTPQIQLDSTVSSTVTMSYKPGVSVSFPFSSTTDWSIENTHADQVSISPTSGKAGKHSLTIKMLSANQSNQERTFSFAIQSTSAASTVVRKSVTLRQQPVFVLEQTTYSIEPEGGELVVRFSTAIPLENLSYWFDNTFAEMMDLEDEEDTRATGWHSHALPVTREINNGFLRVRIKPNTTKKVREGYLLFAEKGVTADKLSDPTSLISQEICIVQDPQSGDSSTDYSADGQVATFQTHTRGDQGVPVILLGDAFIDKEIADGTYDDAMEDAMERLFDIEPMTSLREYFDVYRVNAVSRDNVVTTQSKTAFSSNIHPNSTLITGDDDRCIEYALKAIGKERINDALVLVIINDTRYAGTCAMSVTTPKNGTTSGVSIAYIPMAEEHYTRVLHHEAVGHGLGKLADEYGSKAPYEENGNILEDKTTDESGRTSVEILKLFQQYFALLNVSLESDVLRTPWSSLYRDDRYANEKLGSYEGAYTYPKGVYRPTEQSLMNNTDKLNVVGRNLIYRRVMSIAYGNNWQYDFEDFVELDQPSRTEQEEAGTKATHTILPLPRKHHAPPRLSIH